MVCEALKAPSLGERSRLAHRIAQADLFDGYRRPSLGRLVDLPPSSYVVLSCMFTPAPARKTIVAREPALWLLRPYK